MYRSSFFASYSGCGETIQYIYKKIIIICAKYYDTKYNDADDSFQLIFNFLKLWVRSSYTRLHSEYIELTNTP